MGVRLHKRVSVVAIVVLAGALLVACGSGSGSSGAQTRTVIIDVDNDEFAASMFEYYPQRLQVRPGDTVEFEQKWAGEPHSVTMGKFVQDEMKPLLDLFNRVLESGDLPQGEPQEFQDFGVPGAFAEEGLAQNAAQPCYVTESEFTGTYPGDEKTPCENTEQPAAFSNDHAIYNSGLIPFEGVGGNSFDVKLADDLEPGTYSFFCNVHGALQNGQLEVKAKGTDIPSNGEVARQAREEMEDEIDPLARAWRAASDGKPVKAGETGEMEIETKGKNLIGVPTPFFQDKAFVHGIVNEFVPRELDGKVAEKVTWTFAGFHTISFNVPEYFPVFTIDDKDGTVEFNPQAQEAVGGWPERPGSGPPGDAAEGAEGEPPAGEGEGDGGEGDEGPPEPVTVDAGEWDGRGFKSTGLSYGDGDTFSVTFTRAGTYSFACLIHPPMVGKITIAS